MDHSQDPRYRAVLYLRVAQGQDETSNAVIAQRKACEHIAKRYGVTVVREYIDFGKPARLEQQSELRRLLGDLDRLHDVDYVVVSDFARLGRDSQSLDDVIGRIRARGAEVATITGVETAERFTTGGLLERVAEWAEQPPRSSGEAPRPSRLAVADDLDAAVQTIRHGDLTSDQCAALATLVAIAGNSTLPTVVTAAVFNVVTTCNESGRLKKATD